MKNPLAAWRAGVRWPLVLLSLLVPLVLGVGICEAIGWPFLVGPAQRQLAKTLDRRVVLGADPAVDSGVRIGLLGSVRVRAAVIEVGAPDWSQAPHTFLARRAQLKLGYLDLWRAWRGEPLHIRSLEAAELDSILERQADGRASWQFRNRTDQAEQPGALPTFGVLRVGDGHVAFADAILPARIDARFALSDGSGGAVAAPGASAAGASSPASAAQAASVPGGGERPGFVVRAGRAATNASAPAESVALAPGESGLRLKARGQYKRLPVLVDLRTTGVLAFVGEGAEGRTQPLALYASIGGADLHFEGSTTDPLRLAALKGRFKLAGRSLAAAGEPLGITLPATPPFATRGQLIKDAGLWKAVFDDARIGSSQLNGAFTYDSRSKVPLLAGRLGGARLVLADLGPAVGGGPAPADQKGTRPGRVIPDRRFDLPSLRAMDANVLVDIGMFDPGTEIIEPLRPARAHLMLAGGVLTIANFEGRTAQGSLLGYLQLDGRRNQALWTADLRLAGVDLARFLRLKRSGDAPPYLSGKLDALMKVKGSGRSTAEILGSLEGDLRLHMRNAAISHLVVEAMGIDIAQALGLVVKGDAALPIQCNVADLDIVKGVARPKVFIINTRDSAIWIDGTVSFRDESLDLRAVVSPKDFSPLTLRTPLHVKGTLGAPKVSVEMGKLAGKAGAAALLSLLNPLAAIIPFIDTGSNEDAKKAGAECADLVRTSGVIPPAVRNPKSAPVPQGASVPAAGTAATRRGAGAAGAWRRSDVAGLALVADEVLALRVRLAGLLGLLQLLGFLGARRRGVLRRRLDLAGLGELACCLVVAAGGVVVAFALDFVLAGCRGHVDLLRVVGRRGQTVAVIGVSATSAVTTSKRSRVFGPKHMVIGTSPASRPRAMTMRPMRRLLCRASKVYQRSPRKTSNQALKSIGSGTGGTPMSPR